MDVYVSLRKLSKNGEVLEHVNVPWESLPEGVNTHHDVPMAQTVKVSGFIKPAMEQQKLDTAH